MNEKRRTQRKRKCDTAIKPGSEPGTPGDAFGASAQKRFRISTGEILELNPHAIIVNGPLDGTKHHGPGYEYPEIIGDLHKIVNEFALEHNQLANAMSTIIAPPDHNSPEHVQIDALYNKTFLTVSKGIFLLSQWKSSFDSAVAATTVSEELDSASIADVVASAAAVAAAQSAGTGDQTSNIALLLAAEGKGGDVEKEDEPQEVQV